MHCPSSKSPFHYLFNEFCFPTCFKTHLFHLNFVKLFLKCCLEVIIFGPGKRRIVSNIFSEKRIMNGRKGYFHKKMAQDKIYGDVNFFDSSEQKSGFFQARLPLILNPNSKWKSHENYTHNIPIHNNYKPSSSENISPG